METYRTFGITSQQVIERLKQGVPITDVSDPSLPVQTVYNWIDAGYADGDKLDGKDGALPSLLLTLQDPTTKAFKEIWQDGVAVQAINVPFIIRAAAPTIPILIYNVPRDVCTYHAVAVFNEPNGVATQLAGWDVKIIS